ncbi:hypothetical protein HPB51_019755 [Rhipicephalus microplus]|uniref:Uncharacterized protein n=1 Tax=Rhipicephalus microplus TaxID=6941 RepID=A0A9J6F5H0_RHIMP|nr:hypothetical protein HPB51_019755 [Rhipicephalus microplus]
MPQRTDSERFSRRRSTPGSGGGRQQSSMRLDSSQSREVWHGPRVACRRLRSVPRETMFTFSKPSFLTLVARLVRTKDPASDVTESKTELKKKLAAAPCRLRQPLHLFLAAAVSPQALFAQPTRSARPVSANDLVTRRPSGARRSPLIVSRRPAALRGPICKALLSTWRKE